MPFKEQELILAQQLAGLAIWEWHVESDELKWLPGSVPLFGRPICEIAHRKDAPQPVYEEDRVRVQNAVRKAVDEGGDFDVEYRVQWPNREVHWIRTRGRMVQHPERGKLLIGVTQDTTETKNREQALEAQARLLDLAYEPILVRDAQDRITFWNKGAERLYGYTSKEALGERSHDLLCTKFPDSLEQIEAQLAKHTSWEGELVHRTKDRRLIHVATRWQRLSDKEMWTLETNFDLSHQKALQVAKVWEEKAKLIGELSHEINNPLAAATNATYMLRSGSDHPVQYVDILEESINRIARFIRKSNELHEKARAHEHRLVQENGDQLQ
ncbi:MAG TPA: PAS domain-containing protein [Terriglobales bacterium]|nr:PAS domain-containing protein [Terriglobales bacterium]